MNAEQASGGQKLLMPVVLLIVGAAIGFFVAPVLQPDFKAARNGAGAGETTEFEFVNHIQAEFPEQDVYFPDPDNEDMVVRPRVADGSDEDALAQTVFTVASATEHDPFELTEAPLGPFARGDSLGFTLDDWLAGTASGTYTVQGGQATLEIVADNLVPNGVYTVWCSRIKIPPAPAVVDTACGALDGSENTFTADAQGHAEVVIGMMPLEPSTETVANILALAYHSDGNTHGLEPGDFGANTHVQLFYLMPAE